MFRELNINSIKAESGQFLIISEHYEKNSLINCLHLT